MKKVQPRNAARDPQSTRVFVATRMEFGERGGLKGKWISQFSHADLSYSPAWT